MICEEGEVPAEQQGDGPVTCPSCRKVYCKEHLNWDYQERDLDCSECGALCSDCWAAAKDVVKLQCCSCDRRMCDGCAEECNGCSRPFCAQCAGFAVCTTCGYQACGSCQCSRLTAKCPCQAEREHILWMQRRSARSSR